MTEHVNILSQTACETSAPNLPPVEDWDTPNVRRAASWAELIASIDNDDIELALWARPQRSPAAETNYVPTSEFDIILGEETDILSGFSDMFTESDWPESLREQVRQDVEAFLQAVERKTPEAQYRLRLQSVSDDACRKFHQDRVFQRLIITYRGDGTVWRHVDDSCCEQTAMAMDCVLLRGKRGDEDAKIRHRSPIFSDGHPPRLIMVIDVIPSL